MINLIRETIINYLTEQGLQVVEWKFNIEVPTSVINGHLSTNVLMVYRQKPEELINLLEALPLINKVEYAKPGFLNIFLKPEFLLSVEKTWQKVQEPKQHNISVEYASPNPTGFCHIGHARGSIMGDIIASVLIYLGYNVRKDCIFNDGGNQVEKFIESIYIRYKELTKKATEEELANICYKGEYIKDLAREYIKEESLTREDFWKYKSQIMEKMKVQMKADLRLLDIEHDTITNETSLEREKNICWESLKKDGLLEFQNTEEGQKIFFKSKDFEDDKDRVIERENGTITYFGIDIAYHWKKKHDLPLGNIKECSDQIIVLGDDHIGYLKRLLGAVKNFDINLRVVTHNLVKIIKNGEEVKMSKRNGNFITIRDFVANYGSGDVLRILMIEQGNRSIVSLDLNKLNLEDSPLFYIQYAYARFSSILEKRSFSEVNPQLHLLREEEEQLLMSYLVYWPELIAKIGRTLDIHGLFVYLQGFSKVIHSYLSNHKIIDESFKERTEARHYLIAKCRDLLRIILKILKITPLERM